MRVDRRTTLAAFAAWSSGALAQPAQAQDFAADRRAMVETIRSMVRTDRGPGLPTALSQRVAAVMGAVPRHEFVPASQRASAYENRPLAIGYGQTISQPYIVALMTELAQVAPGARALEIGTGSGYQAAILSDLGAQVYTIEIVPQLARAAAERLRRLGYASIRTRTGDGYNGWTEAQPFDVILVTAAASHVPPPLVRQLKPGGRMVIPVGPPFVTQQLALVTKDAQGAVRTRQLLPVIFVPLTRA